MSKMISGIPSRIDWRLVRRFSVFCAVGVAILITLLILLGSLLPPILISAFFCYLLAPVVDYFGRFKIPRHITVAGLIAVFLALLVVGTSRIVPLLYHQARDLLNLIPSTLESVTSHWIPQVRELLVGRKIIDAQLFDKSVAEISIMAHIADELRQALNTIWLTAPKLLSTILNVVLVPLLTFFLLKDLSGIQGRLTRLVPRDLLPPTYAVLARVNATLRSVIKGQVTVAAILGVLYILGFQLVGLSSGFAIGLVAGLCRIVPYLDVVVGGALSIIVLSSHFHGWGQVFAVIGVFMFVQSVDGMFITPRIVGERVGLHPAVVILSVFVFNDLFGFWGILLAVPMVALVKSLWEAAVPYYYRSNAYTADRGTVEEVSSAPGFNGKTARKEL
jgi:predicted PurR-regulated permease PerM